MVKRVLKVRNAHLVSAFNSKFPGVSKILFANLAENDVERGWPANTPIRTSVVMSASDGANPGSVIETQNTIYEVVD